MTSQRVKNKKVQHGTKSSSVTVLLYTLWRLLYVIYYRTRARKNVINLFYTRKIQKVYWRIFGAWKRKTSLRVTCSLVEQWRYSRWYSITYVCILLLLFVVATKALQATGKHLIFDLGIYPINEWFSVIQLFLDVFVNLICWCNFIVACLFLLFLSNAFMNYAI